MHHPNKIPEKTATANMPSPLFSTCSKKTLGVSMLLKLMCFWTISMFRREQKRGTKNHWGRNFTAVSDITKGSFLGLSDLGHSLFCEEWRAERSKGGTFLIPGQRHFIKADKKKCSQFCIEQESWKKAWPGQLKKQKKCWFRTSERGPRRSSPTLGG